jgi:transposase
MAGLHECRLCPARSLCTRSPRSPRILTVRYQDDYETVQQARAHEQSEPFRLQYAHRSGIEGPHSQAVRGMGLRHTRFRGVPKKHILTAAALNLLRMDAFLAGAKMAKTRISHFATLTPFALAS